MLSFALIILILLYFSAPSLAEYKTIEAEYLQSLTSEIINITCEGNYTTEITKPNDKTCYGSKTEANCTATFDIFFKFKLSLLIDSSSIVITPSTAIITSSLLPTDHPLLPTKTPSDVIIISVTTSTVILGLLLIVITGAIVAFVCIKRKKNNNLRALSVPSHFRENPIYEKTSPMYDVVLHRKDLSLLRGITSGYDVIKESIESSGQHTKKTDDRVTEDVQYIEMSRVHIRGLENSGLCTSNVYY
ncbi:PREDICTED: uncharacterized protein LOC109583729 [Amphimedon queenslandica]|uniref:Uncharacterized protein n=1 Tax=Amphimedon queenslandica TaxID=400682 RepID=A0AAN0JDE3_AMPQE|nr:PREDICTED: uncharacterized protein LOC109583729 [Amphimedon queenslandica]|eukprot:XP_019854733.1 PREDICTED: uncharacterized protein LOC109583729 [Amphimedon queenslandica]